MPDNKNQHNTDEDLLASAIPIDAEEVEDPDQLEVVEDEAGADYDPNDLTPIDVDAAAEAEKSGKPPLRTIQTFGPESRHEDKWNRTPNSPGTGAIHVKTFVTKLRLDAIEHMDQQVNEWLDAHPQYEVKFVTTTVGKLIGKNTEDALFMSVWV